jgi:hypothetical protein
MKHIEILKQAFNISWRYRALWLFGFLLALCGGGNGGGNFNFPGDMADLVDSQSMAGLHIDPGVIVAVIIGVICLVVLLAVIGTVVQYVTRTALIGMVGQIKQTQAVTVRDGWRYGWSKGTWRIFLINLVIGIPLFIISFILILMALSPLLLLLADQTAMTVLGIGLTVLAVILVIFLLIAVSVVIGPIQELSWRRAALDRRGVIVSLQEVIQLIKHRFKDVAVMWLLVFGVSLGWGLAALFIVLPASLLAALIIGGIPALLVYLLSESVMGAAIAGGLPGFLTLILVNAVAAGFFLIYQSSIWTLTYLELTAGASSTDEAVMETPL